MGSRAVRALKKIRKDELNSWEKMIALRQVVFRERSSCVTNIIRFNSTEVDIMQKRDGWVDCGNLNLKIHLFDRMSFTRPLWMLNTIYDVFNRS